MSSTTERYIRLYQDLVREVNRRAGSSSSHAFEIEQAARRDGTVKRHVELLKYIRDVRHTLQHPKHSSPGNAVEVSEAFLSEVAKLLGQLQNSTTSGSLGVPRKMIRTTNHSDLVGVLANAMKEGGFSHVPIVDADDVVVGVFNEAAIFDYLWSEEEKIVGRSMPLHELLPYCRPEVNHTETFKFVNPRVPLEDVVDMFVALDSPKTRVGAVFVTASGKSTEKLQRLITAWDGP